MAKYSRWTRNSKTSWSISHRSRPSTTMCCWAKITTSFYFVLICLHILMSENNRRQHWNALSNCLKFLFHCAAKSVADTKGFRGPCPPIGPYPAGGRVAHGNTIFNTFASNNSIPYTRLSGASEHPLSWILKMIATSCFLTALEWPNPFSARAPPGTPCRSLQLSLIHIWRCRRRG